MSKSELIEFFKSKEFCNEFGHLMQTSSQGWEGHPIQLSVGTETYEIANSKMISHIQKCLFCERQVMWTKESNDWVELDKNGCIIKEKLK